MQKTFVTYNDPGHGWIKVPEGVLSELGLRASDFSSFSYLDRGHMFLEEDGDASLFVRTYRDKTGELPRCNAKHCDGQSRVRSKYPNNTYNARILVPTIADPIELARKQREEA